MHCVITAGGLPEPDSPLYDYTQGKSKALLKMGRRTMLEHVIDALQASDSVEEIVVVGLGDDQGMSFQRPVHHGPDQGSLIGNVIHGMHWVRKQYPDTEHVLLCTADIPAITGNIVDKFVASCHPLTNVFYYNFVEKKVMEARFPGSNRTFVKLKGLNIAGGDLMIAHLDLADSHRDLWEALTQARKHAWKLAGVIGFRFLFKFLTRQVGFKEIEEVGLRILGRPIKAMLSPYAELAMDADKPHQVDLLRRDLSKR